MRRVVVTGLGIVSPFGRGVEYNWKSILDGKSGIRKIENIDLRDIPVHIAGQVPTGKGEHEFDPDSVMAPKDQKKNDRFILYGMAAGGDALEDAGWNPETATEDEKYRFGVMMGSGIGGLDVIYENSVSFHENGMKRIAFINGLLVANLYHHPLLMFFVMTVCRLHAVAFGMPVRMDCGRGRPLCMCSCTSHGFSKSTLYLQY